MHALFLAKARRQTKAVKPKKMIRLEGKTIINSACNSGTSALVTQDGEVYVFGKDTLYCDHVTGKP
jgi:E3 ubiquitin-protein ligase MYCBP2